MKIILLSMYIIYFQSSMIFALAKQPIIPQKIILKKKNSLTGKREVFILFENITNQIIQSPSITLTIDSNTYKGGIFAKTSHGYHLNYPIRHSQKGAIIFKINPKKWKQCQKVKIEIPQIISSTKNLRKKEKDHIYLRVEDQNYASNCTHLN